MKEIETPISFCPACKYQLDTCVGADMLDQGAPRGGDVSICVNCGTLLVFNEDGTQRLPTDVEWSEFADTVIDWPVAKAAMRHFGMRRN